MHSAEHLPLLEGSFVALEAAYEKQWCLAQHTAQQRDTKRAKSTVATSVSAALAAEEMKRLWTETQRLHARFLRITNAGAPPFTNEELQMLASLGFATPTPPVSGSASSRCHKPLTPALRHSNENTQPDVSAAKLAKENAALRQEAAQLMSALAWYRFRDNPTAAQTASTHGVDCDAPSTEDAHRAEASSELLARFSALQQLSHTLCCRTSSSEQHSQHLAATYATTAVDVAIRELLEASRFPPQVRVVRVESSAAGLYLLDRPVRICFASSQSTTLVVQDPDGLEEDCELHHYLLQLYEPLLRAVQWTSAPSANTAAQTAPPSLFITEPAVSTGVRARQCSTGDRASSTVDSELQPLRPPVHTALSSTALSQLSYAELVALKQSTLKQIGRVGAE